MEKEIIDLEKYRTPLSKVFTGRDRGIEIRSKSKIDHLVTDQKKIIEIVIPNNVMSVNPSFLEEFLYNAVNYLGKKQFKERVLFRNLNSRYDFDPDLDEAIERILRRNNALSK